MALTTVVGLFVLPLQYDEGSTPLPKVFMIKEVSKGTIYHPHLFLPPTEINFADTMSSSPVRPSRRDRLPTQKVVESGQ